MPWHISLGCWTTATTATGVDLLRIALRSAMEKAKQRGTQPGTLKTKKRTRPARRAGRDPIGLGYAINAMMAERPWIAPTALMPVSAFSAYVHLPNVETLGFAISQVPRFDVVPPAVNAQDPHLLVGQVLKHHRATGGRYQVPLKSLTRHVFIPGTTGSGKTNTIMGLLLEASAHGVPFLVIEPAKAEYRSLISHPVLGRDIQIFTAGKATVGPFVLNPFEVPASTTVSEHLDLLRAVFTASFGMWTPLP
ncbi:helicase HerA domain-containing protein [Streptomyces sp. NPDC002206]